MHRRLQQGRIHHARLAHVDAIDGRAVDEQRIIQLAGAGFASPRLMGEAAHGLGAVTRGATNITNKMPLQLPALSPVLVGMSSQLLLQPLGQRLRLQRLSCPYLQRLR